MHTTILWAKKFNGYINKAQNTIKQLNIGLGGFVTEGAETRSWIFNHKIFLDFLAQTGELFESF